MKNSCLYFFKLRLYLLVIIPLNSYAQVRTLGEMFAHLGNSFPSFGKVIVGIAYVSGVGFGIASAYKFKQYKDNPTQIPIGTPIALLIVSTLLVFMPALTRPAAVSLFGTTQGSGWFITTTVDCLPGHVC